MSEELMDLTAEEQMIATEQITPEEGNAFKLATVTALLTDGCAQIKFDEDEEASEKEYAYLSCYAPAVNDRVLLGIVGASYVILGKVNYAVSPATAASASINGVTLAGALSLSDIGAAPESHTHAWSDISSQPKINNKTLASGNNTLATLGIAAEEHDHTQLYFSNSYQGSAKVSLNTTSFYPSTTNKINLGENSYAWKDLYINGTASLRGSTYICKTSTDKLYFFDSSRSNPPSQQSISYVSTASSVTALDVAKNLRALETALIGYNLFKGK